MRGSNPNRMTLLERKSQIKLAAQGADLLKKRRDALMQELFKLLQPLRSMRRDLANLAQAGAQSAIMTTSLEGVDHMRSNALAGRASLTVEMRATVAAGLKVWELNSEGVRRGVLQRGYAPEATGTGTTEVASGFESILEAILKMLPLDMRLRRIGREIRRTTRRVNALEQSLLPRLRADAAEIRAVLEQREREEIFRLKRQKSRSSRKAAEPTS